MASFKEELKELLLEEVSVYKKLLKIADEKTEIIISNNLKNLDDITKKEEEFVLNLTRIEQKREILLNTWGISKNISLSKIISNIPDQNIDDLKKLKKDFLNVITKLKEKNDLNNVLIKDSLEYIDFNLNLIGDVKSPVTYGKQSLEINNSMFDRKV